MRFSVLLLALALTAPSAAAQADALTRARQTLDAGTASESADSLLAARASLSLLADGPDADWATYYAALADYRLAYAFWGADAERAQRHAAAGAAALEALRARRDLAAGLPAEAAALHSALIGAQIGLDGARAIDLGPASQATLADAVRLAPENPRVLYVQAVSLLSTPPEWGGDPDAGEAALRRAVALFDARDAADAGTHAPRWGHSEAYAWLGMAALMRGDADAARGPIETAEAMSPRSAFVRYKLRPWLDSLTAGAAAAQ